MTLRASGEWAQGRWGETTARRWFEEQDWFVIPVAFIEDHGAPKLTRLLEGRILPDMQVAHRGDMRWVEVKTKTRAVLYQRTGRWRHGINLRHWLDYLAVEHETGMPGHLAIVELEPEPLLLLAAFAELTYGVQSYRGDAMPDGSAMAWFDRDRFERYPLDPVGRPPRLEPKRIRPWEKDRRPPGADGPQQTGWPW